MRGDSVKRYSVASNCSSCCAVTAGWMVVRSAQNDNLQAMLQTLYGYWFLQFDFPDENGQPYRSSGGRMVWNNQLKREIPAGWLVASITDHADVYQPKTISSRLFDDSHPFPVYGGGGYIGRFNQFNHQESEVIISCRGDCGRVYLTMPESWVTGNAMVVHPRGDCLPKEYLYLLLKNSNLEHYVTGSVQKQLTRQNFELLPILVPSRDVLERFTSFTKITISRQLEIVRENRKLQELRDWLLPMLMNGQATVTSSDKLSFAARCSHRRRGNPNREQPPTRVLPIGGGRHEATSHRGRSTEDAQRARQRPAQATRIHPASRD